MLWTIWLHRNEVLFKGRMGSIDGVVQDLEGLNGVLVSSYLVGRSRDGSCLAD